MNANQTELTNAVETEAASSVPSAVKKIIVAVGLSAHSEATARYAARWAEVFAASLNLVHVCPLELVDGFGISPEPVTALRLHGGSAQEALSVLIYAFIESSVSRAETAVNSATAEMKFAGTGAPEPALREPLLCFDCPNQPWLRRLPGNRTKRCRCRPERAGYGPLLCGPVPYGGAGQTRRAYDRLLADRPDCTAPAFGGGL